MTKNCGYLYSGQMLIEVIIAVGIIALVLVGVSDLMTRSLRVVTFQKQKDEASAILTKIQNNYKAQRDANPELFYTSIPNTPTTINPCEVGKTYVCTISWLKAADDKSVTITAVVTWSDSVSVGLPNVLSVTSIQTLLRSVK